MKNFIKIIQEIKRSNSNLTGCELLKFVKNIFKLRKL